MAVGQDALHQGSSSGGSLDAVDRIIEQWHRERPDLDPSAKAISGRLIRLADLFQRRYGEVFEPLDLSEGDYGILAALRRAGEPHRLTPTQLARTRMMTSGGMTAVIDRLEKRGLVERTPNPDDRRGSLVGLTAEGLERIERAMEVHTDAEHELVAALSDRERATLERLLRKLLLSVDADS